MDAQSPLFDRLAALERLEGDEELLREIVGIFLEDAPHLFLSLKQARSERDQKTSERQAHSLKGASANVGAVALQEVSLVAENFAREGRWESLEELLPEMERLLHESMDALREDLR